MFENGKYLITEDSNEFIQIADVLINYKEWEYRKKEVPEVVAAEFLIELCPRLNLVSVIDLIVEYEIRHKHDGSHVRSFLKHYLEKNDIFSPGVRARHTLDN